MSRVALSGNPLGTGTFTIASPNSNTDRTLNLPDASGTLNTSGAPNEVPAGSAAAPAIYPAGDTNTGIFFPAADTIAFSEGGVESARIDASGNLGLGVTPSAWESAWKSFDIGAVGSITSGYGEVDVGNNFYRLNTGAYRYKTTAVATNYIQSGGQHLWYTAPSGTAGNAISFTQAMTLDASGNLGVGTTTAPQVNGKGLAIYDTNFPRITLRNSTSGDGTGDGFQMVLNGADVDIANQENGAIKFFTNGPNERARIDSSGNFLVGTTVTPSSSSSGCSIEDGAMRTSFGSYTGAGDHIFFINGNGTVGRIASSGSTTSYVTSSDYRLKEDIQPMTGALAKVALLKPCTYKWNADGSDGEGFIAHELQAVIPDAVTGAKDATRMERYEISPAVPATFDEEGNELTAAVEAVMGEREVPSYQGIDTSFLVATLTAAIQELKAIVDAQGAEIAALKGQS